MKNDLTPEQLQQEVCVNLPLGVLLRLGESRPLPDVTVVDVRLPAIGAQLDDGIFAGVSVENDHPVALVLLPGDEELKWKDAIEWAEGKGGALPSRIDQLVLFKNLKAEFQSTWYWSSEQYAGGESYAWYQTFSGGGQGNGRKDLELRARAVRRLPLE